MLLKLRSLTVLFILLLVLPVTQAATRAGKVHTSIGRSMAASPDGDIRVLKRGGPLYSGETITTGPNSYVRMALTDKGFIMLRPNTRFVIEEYRHTGVAKQERGFFSLLRGGFRAVTGLVGKLNRRNFRVRTPVATIGIRGTDFEARYCLGDCDAPDGLYHRVFVGGTDLSNPGGSRSGNPGEFYHVPGPNSPPQGIGSQQAKPLTDEPMPPADPEGCPVN